jgi:hypothetical protein
MSGTVSKRYWRSTGSVRRLNKLPGVTYLAPPTPPGNSPSAQPKPWYPSRPVDLQEREAIVALPTRLPTVVNIWYMRPSPGKTHDARRPKAGPAHAAPRRATAPRRSEGVTRGKSGVRQGEMAEIPLLPAPLTAMFTEVLRLVPHLYARYVPKDAGSRSESVATVTTGMVYSSRPKPRWTSAARLGCPLAGKSATCATFDVTSTCRGRLSSCVVERRNAPGCENGWKVRCGGRTQCPRRRASPVRRHARGGRKREPRAWARRRLFPPWPRVFSWI